MRRQAQPLGRSRSLPDVVSQIAAAGDEPLAVATVTGIRVPVWPHAEVTTWRGEGGPEVGLRVDVLCANPCGVLASLRIGARSRLAVAHPPRGLTSPTSSSVNAPRSGTLGRETEQSWLEADDIGVSKTSTEPYDILVIPECDTPTRSKRPTLPSRSVRDSTARTM